MEKSNVRAHALYTKLGYLDHDDQGTRIQIGIVEGDKVIAGLNQA